MWHCFNNTLTLMLGSKNVPPLCPRVKPRSSLPTMSSSSLPLNLWRCTPSTTSSLLNSNKKILLSTCFIICTSISLPRNFLKPVLIFGPRVGHTSDPQSLGEEQSPVGYLEIDHQIPKWCWNLTVSLVPWQAPPSRARHGRDYRPGAPPDPTCT